MTPQIQSPKTRYWRDDGRGTLSSTLRDPYLISGLCSHCERMIFSNYVLELSFKALTPWACMLTFAITRPVNTGSHFAHHVQSTRLYEVPPYAQTSPRERDSHPLWCFLPKRLTQEVELAKNLKTTIQEQSSRLAFWAFPGSVALTNGIIFIFFSSTYLYA